MVIDFAVLVSTGDRALMEHWTPKGIYPAISVARLRLPFNVAQGLAQALNTQLAKVGEVFQEEMDGKEAGK